MNTRRKKQSPGISKYGRYFIACGTVFGLITCGLILVVGMVFETNDDREFSSILAGSFGLDNAAYTVFINYALSLLYKGIFLLLGTDLNWYVACSLLLSCVALASIQAIILDCVRGPLRWFLVVAAYLFVVHDQFLSFQFTKNAAFYTAAAMIGFNAAFFRQEEQDNYHLLSVISGILLVLGFLTRDKAALLVIAFYILLDMGLFIYICVVRQHSFRSVAHAVTDKRHRAPVVSLVVAGLTIAVCTLLNQAAYSSEAWQEYLEINDINFSLLSGDALPGYQGNEELYNSLGLDLNDYELYRDWSGGDSEVFSLETVAPLLEVGSDSRQVIDLNQLINTLLAERGLAFQLLLVAIIAVGALLATNRFGKLAVIVLLLMLCAEVGYLLFSGSFSHRVFYSAVVGALTALLTTLFLIPQVRGSGVDLWAEGYSTTKSPILLAFCLLAVIAAGMYSAVNFSETDVRWKRDASYSRLLDLVREDKEHFYTFDRTTTTYLAMNGKNPLRTTGVDDYSNMAYLGGWIALTPVNRSGLNRYGVQSAYELLGSVQETYIIDSRHAEMICQFVRRHYCADAELVKVGQIGTTNIYNLNLSGTANSTGQ